MFRGQSIGEKKWYDRSLTFVVSFLIVGPFALPLIWRNPHYSRKAKVWITVAVIAVTLLLLGLLVEAQIYLGEFLQKQVQSVN